MSPTTTTGSRSPLVLASLSFFHSRVEDAIGTVFVSGLDAKVTLADIEEAFGAYGRVVGAWVARSPPGFALVVYQDEQDAHDAIEEMNGARLGGSLVTCRLKSTHPCATPDEINTTETTSSGDAGITKQDEKDVSETQDLVHTLYQTIRKDSESVAVEFLVQQFESRFTVDRNVLVTRATRVFHEIMEPIMIRTAMRTIRNHFSNADLRHLLDFLVSPIGKKYLDFSADYSKTMMGGLMSESDQKRALSILSEESMVHAATVPPVPDPVPEPILDPVDGVVAPPSADTVVAMIAPS